MTKEEKVKEFNYKKIKSFEDACAHLEIDPKQLPEVPIEDLKKPVIAAYKLMIIFKAINNGWNPDWSDRNQYKYFPWFEVLSSGFGFSGSVYDYPGTGTSVGSRLCTDTRDKALYIADHFKEEYQDYFLYSK